MGKEPDHLFADIVLAQGLLTEEQVKDLRNEAARLCAMGVSRTLLQITAEKKLLSPNQTAFIRRKMANGGALPRLGSYELIARLGEGAMGTVYKARQVSLDRVVAIKVLRRELARDEKYIRRFEREARLAAKLSHPNAVQVHDVGQDRGLHFIVMEFTDGPSLASILEKGPLDETRSLEITRDLAGALALAHARKIIHRDIKPSNILMMSDGTAKISDLGIAKDISGTTTFSQAGALAGTPVYMSPEQCMGKEVIDHRADIYSLGITLYHMVCGAPPFKASTPVAVVNMHITTPLPEPTSANSSLSPPTAQLIKDMAAKDPSARVQSCDELAERIERILSGRDRGGVRGRGAKWPGRKVGAQRRTQAKGFQAQTALVAPESGVAKETGFRYYWARYMESRLAKAALWVVCAAIFGTGVFLLGRRWVFKPQMEVMKPKPVAARPVTPSPTVEKKPMAAPAAPSSRVVAEKTPPASRPEPKPAKPPAKQAKGLVAHYTFDEGKGAVLKDHSGNGNHGTIHGAKWVKCDYGYALQFDGKDDYVDCGASPSLNIEKSGTVMLWFRPDALQGGLVCRSTGENWSDERFVLALITTGKKGEESFQNFAWHVSDGEETICPGMKPENSRSAWLVPPVVGKWSHVAVTLEGARVRLYQEGTLVYAAQLSLTPSFREVPMIIGRSEGLGIPFFKGLIDEVRVYSDALSSEEVAKVCETTIRHPRIACPVNTGKGKEPRLAAHYTFDEGSGTVLKDRSGNANHGVIHGATWVKCGKGHALRFDGVTHFVGFFDKPCLRIIGPITVMAWVHPEDTRRLQEPIILGKHSVFALGLRAGRKVYWYSFPNFAGGGYVEAPIQGGQWQHICGSFDGEVRKLYVNGTLRESKKWTVSTIRVGKSLLMGCGVWDFYRTPPHSEDIPHFEGMLDEVRIYAGALSDQEIRDHYEETRER